MNNLSPFELGWVVGILEGEGSFSVNTKGQRILRVQVYTTDQDVVVRLQKTLGIGNITGPHVRRYGNVDLSNAKPQWYWVLLKGSVPLMCLILPHMSHRRAERIRELLTYHTSYGASNDQLSLI